jgi:hypothetical protein
MSSYATRGTASELRRRSFKFQSSDDEAAPDSDRRRVAMHASEKDLAHSDAPTLDDFGGRSDALGG